MRFWQFTAFEHVFLPYNSKFQLQLLLLVSLLLFSVIIIFFCSSVKSMCRFIFTAQLASRRAKSITNTTHCWQGQVNLTVALRTVAKLKMDRWRGQGDSPGGNKLTARWQEQRKCHGKCRQKSRCPPTLLAAAKKSRKKSQTKLN